jgi:hypothetical protein
MSNDAYLSTINSDYCLKHCEHTGSLILQAVNTGDLKLNVSGSNIATFTSSAITLNASGNNIATFSPSTITLNIGTANMATITSSSIALNVTGNNIATFAAGAITFNQDITLTTTKTLDVPNLNVGAATTIHGSFSTWGDITQSGNKTISTGTGDVIVNGDLYISDTDLNVGSGTSTFTGPIVASSGITVTGNITGTLATATQGNITSVGTLTGISCSGNIGQSGAYTFSTGTSAVSLNGDVTIASGKSLTLPSIICSGGIKTSSTGNTNATSDYLTSTATIKTAGGMSVAGKLYAGNLVVDNSGTLTCAGLITASSGITVTGGITGVLLTAGQTNITSLGTLTGITCSGNISGTLTTASQPNITGVGILLGLTSNGIIKTSSTTNTNATSDYTTSTAVIKSAGGMSCAGILYCGNLVIDNSGTLTCAGLITASSGITVTGNITGTLATAAQGNITSLGTLTGISCSGNISGTLTTAAQGNITSLGTLTGITCSGNISGTLTTAAQGNITSLGTLTGITCSGNISGTLTTAAQGNITSLGTLTGITCSGTINANGGIAATTQTITTTSGAIYTTSGAIYSGTGVIATGSLCTTGDVGSIYTKNTYNGVTSSAFTDTNATLSSAGCAAIAGKLYCGTLVVDNSGTITCAGLITANGGLTAAGNISQSSTYTFSTGSGSVALNGNVTIASGKSFTGSSTASSFGGQLTVSGALNCSGLVTANAGIYAGTQTISTSSGGIFTSTGSIYVNGTGAGDIWGTKSCLATGSGVSSNSLGRIYTMNTYNGITASTFGQATGATLSTQGCMSVSGISYFGGNVYLDNSAELGATGTRVAKGWFTSITCTNAITIDSDESLKKDMNPIDNSFAKSLICDLDPITYIMKEDVDNKTQFGFSAQDIRDALNNLDNSKPYGLYQENFTYKTVTVDNPNAAEDNDDVITSLSQFKTYDKTIETRVIDESVPSTLAVNYIALIAPMVCCIKDLYAEINTLKARVAVLENH